MESTVSDRNQQFHLCNINLHQLENHVQILLHKQWLLELVWEYSGFVSGFKALIRYLTWSPKCLAHLLKGFGVFGESVAENQVLFSYSKCQVHAG